MNAARIAMARLYARLGWPGCAGLLCLLAAALLLAWAHQARLALRPLAAPASVASAPDIASAPTRAALVTAPMLPRAADSVQLLRMLEKEAKAHGLAWPQAEYRITPLSHETLGTFEIRTTLRGPYPKLRQMLTTLLNKHPALAMRELTLIRQNSDEVEVEAKIRWAFFLGDGWPPAERDGQP